MLCEDYNTKSGCKNESEVATEREREFGILPDLIFGVDRTRGPNRAKIEEYRGGVLTEQKSRNTVSGSDS